DEHRQREVVDDEKHGRGNDEAALRREQRLEVRESRDAVPLGDVDIFVGGELVGRFTAAPPERGDVRRRTGNRSEIGVFLLRHCRSGQGAVYETFAPLSVARTVTPLQRAATAVNLRPAVPATGHRANAWAAPKGRSAKAW